MIHISGQLMMIKDLRLRDHSGGCYKIRFNKTFNGESRSLAGIVGSSPAGGMGVCLLWVLCFFG